MHLTNQYIHQEYLEKENKELIALLEKLEEEEKKLKILSKEKDGWIDCDGSMLRIKDYQELFNVIGYTYGAHPEYFWVPKISESHIKIKENGSLIPIGTICKIK